MAQKEEIEYIMSCIRNQKAVGNISHMNLMNAGEMAVMAYLTEHANQATAGQISQALKVSTARMAVLLNKLEQKGYLVRQKDSEDKRKVKVHLSEAGQVYIGNIIAGQQKVVGILIDRMGYENLKQLFTLTEELKNHLHEILGPTGRIENCPIFTGGDEKK